MPGDSSPALYTKGESYNLVRITPWRVLFRGSTADGIACLDPYELDDFLEIDSSPASDERTIARAANIMDGKLPGDDDG